MVVVDDVVVGGGGDGEVGVVVGGVFDWVRVEVWGLGFEEGGYCEGLGYKRGNV